MSSKLMLMGVDVASFGDPFIAGSYSRSIVFEDAHSGVYKRISLGPDGKHLLGGVLIGDAEAYNMLLQIVNNKLVLPPYPEDLILGARGNDATEGAGMMSLPDEALVCSCEAVTRSAICTAVTERHITSLDGMKKCTRPAPM